MAQGQEDELRAPVLLTSDDEDAVEPDPSDEVDLTRGNIREASLLDRESNALGEVDAARPKTDESGPRAVVPRGRGGR